MAVCPPGLNHRTFPSSIPVIGFQVAAPSTVTFSHDDSILLRRPIRCRRACRCASWRAGPSTARCPASTTTWCAGRRCAPPWRRPRPSPCPTWACCTSPRRTRGASTASSRWAKPTNHVAQRPFLLSLRGRGSCGGGAARMILFVFAAFVLFYSQPVTRCRLTFCLFESPDVIFKGMRWVGKIITH